MSCKSSLRFLVLALLGVPVGPAFADETPIPRIDLSRTTLSFRATEGRQNPGTQRAWLRNTGDSNSLLEWTATSDQPWLTVSPTSGTLRQGDKIELRFHVNARYQVEGWVGATSLINAPSPRRIHSAVWAANQMVVWGGSASPDQQYDDGGRYDPVTNTWLGSTSLVDPPTARHFHTAVWTGGEMIVWGGWSNGTSYVNTGKLYFPDAWLGELSTLNAPGAREAHTAVWTGAEMIVWGGWVGPHLNTGGRYEPVTNTWTGATRLENAPQARQEHAAVWAGNRMIVWGGRGSEEAPPFGGSLNTGGLYDPETDTWTAETAVAGAPAPRINPSAVWTGREMIVWGGYDQDAGGVFYNTGKRYDPVGNRWLKPLPTAGAPSARMRHRAVWNGTKMIVWGGEDADGALNTGGIYQPPIPAMGSHSALITVSASGATGSPAKIQVCLTVDP